MCLCSPYEGEEGKGTANVRNRRELLKESVAVAAAFAGAPLLARGEATLGVETPSLERHIERPSLKRTLFHIRDGPEPDANEYGTVAHKFDTRLEVRGDPPIKEEFIVETTPNPLISVTNYPWYVPANFDGDLTQPPNGPFDSREEALKANGYYDDRFRALRKNGVDAIAGVITGFRNEGLGTDWQSENDYLLTKKYPLYGLKFYIFYDSMIRAAWKLSQFNNQPTSFRFNMDECPAFAEMIAADFARIADDFVLPCMDNYLFLQDDKGQLILDPTNNQPRPLVSIFGSHEWHDDHEYATMKMTCDGALADIFHGRGLGRPALMLDDLMFSDVMNSSNRIAAFGTNVAAITTLMPVDPEVGNLNRVTYFGDWAPLLANLFSSAADRLFSLIADGSVHPNLQLWPGISLNRDSRRQEGYVQNPGGFGWPAKGPEDSESVFRTALGGNVRVIRRGVSDGGVPRGIVQVYDNEFYESVSVSVSLDTNGQKTYPYHYGDDPLLSIAKVLGEMGNLRTAAPHLIYKRLHRE